MTPDTPAAPARSADNWFWWYSDNEERWDGPCESREEAIETGRDTYDSESFMVMEACQDGFHMHLSLHTITDWLDEQNYDLADPDGDQPMTDIANPAQQRALHSAINIAIDHWIVENNINTRAWVFKKTRNLETIEP